MPIASMGAAPGQMGAPLAPRTADGALPAMEVRGLRFAYGRNEVLKGVDLLVPAGKVTTILGPNGCGKSTLFALMTKNLTPMSGKVFLAGRNIRNIALKDFARRVSIVHQNNMAAADMTVEQLVRLGRAPHQKPMTDLGDDDERLVEWALDVTGIAALRLREVARLSGGQRQRVWIAMALAQNTRILFLDEPTTYLDIRYQLDILDLVRRLNREFGITVVMVLHDINQAIAYSDFLVGLKDGVVAMQGIPEDVVTEESIHALYGVNLKVTQANGKKYVLLRESEEDPDGGTEMTVLHGAVPSALDRPCHAENVVADLPQQESVPEDVPCVSQRNIIFDDAGVAPAGAGVSASALPDMRDARETCEAGPDLRHVSEATQKAMAAAASKPQEGVFLVPNPHVSQATLAAMGAAGAQLAYELPRDEIVAECAEDERVRPARSKSRVGRALWAVLGLACFGLGTVGVVLPVLPTVPLYLAALFCFAKGSQRLHDWFVGTDLYHKHLEGFVAHRGMTLRTKLSIMGMVTLVMAIAFFLMSRVPVARVILVAVWVFHVIFFTFFVKTDKPGDGDDGAEDASRLAYEGEIR